MKLEDYRRDLLQEIRATAMAEGISERAAFVSEVASILEDAEELSDFREAYFEMIGPKGKKNPNRRLFLQRVGRMPNYCIVRFPRER